MQALTPTSVAYAEEPLKTPRTWSWPPYQAKRTEQAEGPVKEALTLIASHLDGSVQETVAKLLNQS
jgi:hypothetical protein